MLLDLVLLDTDIFSEPIMEITDTKLLFPMVAVRWII